MSVLQPRPANHTSINIPTPTVWWPLQSKFYPLVFESFGGFGKGAREFIYLAADSAVDVAGGGYLERSDILDYIRCSIAYAIVNGNAALIRNGIKLAANHR